MGDVVEAFTKYIPVAIKRRALSINFWKKYVDDELKAWQGPGSSSKNFPVMANVIRLYVDRSEVAIQWWERFLYMELGKFWQSDEIFSRMKSPWTAICVAAARHWLVDAKDRRVGAGYAAELATQWLRAFWGFCAMMANNEREVHQKWRIGPMVAMCGPRSSPAVYGQNQIDDLFTMAIGLPVETKRPFWALEVGRLIDRDLGLDKTKQQFLRDFISERDPVEILGSSTIILGMTGPVRAEVPYHVIRTEKGTISWIDENPNAWSIPTYVGKVDFKTDQATYYSPGALVDKMGRRHKWPPGKVEKLKNKTLLARASFEGIDWERWVELPEGQGIHFTINGVGTELEPWEYGMKGADSDAPSRDRGKKGCLTKLFGWVGWV